MILGFTIAQLQGPIAITSLPLATDAATETQQLLMKAYLATIAVATAATAVSAASIDTKTPALGAAVKAASTPVNIASDQTVPVSAVALPLPALASTSTLQTAIEALITASNAILATIKTDTGNIYTRQADGNQKTQRVDAAGNVAPAGDVVARAIYNLITDGANTLNLVQNGDALSTQFSIPMFAKDNANAARIPVMHAATGATGYSNVYSFLGANARLFGRNPATGKYDSIEAINQQIKATLYDSLGNEGTLITDDSGDGRVAKIDGNTHALMGITLEHTKVHNALMFHATHHFGTTASGTARDFLLITPDTTEWAHLLITIEGTGETEWWLYEAATYSAIGTACAALNHNRNSATAATTLCYYTPTITGTGTQLAHSRFGSGKSGGESRGVNEWVLKRNTIYLIRATSRSAGNQLTTIGDFYEHTNL